MRSCIFCQFTNLPIAHNMREWMVRADHTHQERLRTELFNTGALVLFRGRWFVNGALTDAEVDRTLELTDRAIQKICSSSTGR